MSAMLADFLQLFFLYVVILDPFMSFASFLSLTKRLPDTKRRSIAILATLLAGVLLAIVLFSGTAMLDMFSIKIDDFKIAGGIVLALLGIRTVLGTDASSEKKPGTVEAISTIIATPLITGPAAIMTTILSVSQHGMLLTGLAAGSALAIVFVGLYFATYFSRFFGKTSVLILSTMLGLVTLAWGVAFIRQGLAGV